MWFFYLCWGLILIAFLGICAEACQLRHQMRHQLRHQLRRQQRQGNGR